jgi:hypothetical protein
MCEDTHSWNGVADAAVVSIPIPIPILAAVEVEVEVVLFGGVATLVASSALQLSFSGTYLPALVLLPRVRVCPLLI